MLAKFNLSNIELIYFREIIFLKKIVEMRFYLDIILKKIKSVRN